MDFSYPYLLFLIPLFLIVSIPLFIYKKNHNKTSLKLFIGNNSNLMPPSLKSVSLIRFIIFEIAVILLILSISRPQKGFMWQEMTTSGIDIVVAVDTSRSMEVTDVKPDRLTRAKMALLELSGQLKGDRIALVPFAGSSFVMTPFTADYNIFNQNVMSLSTYTIPKGGTNLQSAIASSSELFVNNNSNKIIILVTDGEDLANQGIAESENAASKGIQIFTVGVGTKEGELIPDPDRNGQFLKDNQGNLVKSMLDEESLKRIANITKADYRDLSSNGNGILQIYNEKLLELEQKKESEQRSKVPVDIYRYFLFPGIILLLLEFMFVNISRRFSGKKTLASIIFLASAVTLFSNSGDDALKSGDVGKAISLYSNQKEKDFTTLYNMGTANYMVQDYDKAIELYNQSLKTADGTFSQKIMYNLGNSYYRKSQQSQDTSEKIELLENSVKSYEGSIALNNLDDQVVKNRDFVQKLLDELKDQQNQDQQNQDQQNQDQQNQDQQNQDQQNQDQQNQDQQNQDQQNQDQQNQDQQNQDQQNQDQQNQEQQNQAQQQVQPENGKMSKDEAEALLKALESEDVDFKYLLRDSDNTYTGEW